MINMANVLHLLGHDISYVDSHFYSYYRYCANVTIVSDQRLQRYMTYVWHKVYLYSRTEILDTGNWQFLRFSDLRLD